jgi:uncharacterized protein YndB with AHSA1/START domain
METRPSNPGRPGRAACLAGLHAEVVIDATPDEVFDSIIQPEHFRRWFGANVDIEPLGSSASINVSARDGGPRWSACPFSLGMPERFADCPYDMIVGGDR